MERFRESWRATAWRSGAIALAIGVGVGFYRRQLAAVPLATLTALWFTLGGHVVEVLLRNRLLPRLGESRAPRIAARLAGWFAGGSLLYAAALATRAVISGEALAPPAWWIGGLAFIGLELLVHLVMHTRGMANFYDGRG
jgi:hypothetical protein